MLRYRLLRGDSPSARRCLASGRSRGSEICDLSGMDGSLRQSFMKQMGWRPSMNKRQAERIRRSLRRVWIISLSLRSGDVSCSQCDYTGNTKENRKQIAYKLLRIREIPQNFSRSLIWVIPSRSVTAFSGASPESSGTAVTPQITQR